MNSSLIQSHIVPSALTISHLFKLLLNTRSCSVDDVRIKTGNPRTSACTSCPRDARSPSAGHMTRVHQTGSVTGFTGFSGTEFDFCSEKNIKLYKRNQRERDVRVFFNSARGNPLNHDRTFILIVQTGSGTVMLFNCTSGHPSAHFTPPLAQVMDTQKVRIDRENQ